MGSAHTKMQGTLVAQPPPAKPLVPVSAKEVQLSLAHTKEGWLVSRFDHISSTDKTDSSAACTTESRPDTRSSTESGIDAEEPIGPVIVTGTSVPDDIPDDGSTEDLTPSSTFSQASIAATSITKMIRSRPRASQLSELGAHCSEPVAVSFLDSSGETIALLSAEHGPSYRTCDRRAVTLYASEPPDVVESRDDRFDSWILQEGVGAIPSSTSLATRTLADGRVLYAVAKLEGRFGPNFEEARGTANALGIYPLESDGRFRHVCDPALLIMHAADGIVKNSRGEAVAYTRGCWAKKSAVKVAAGVDVALVLALVAEMEIRVQGADF